MITVKPFNLAALKVGKFACKIILANSSVRKNDELQARNDKQTPITLHFRLIKDNYNT